MWATLLTACAAVEVRANLIDLGYADNERGASPEKEAMFLNVDFLDPDGSFLYLIKNDRVNGWTYGGVFSDPSRFTVTYVDTDDDPSKEVFSEARLTWNLEGSGYQLDYVLVKDGGSWYHVYGVTEDQKLSNNGIQAAVWLDEKGKPKDISHISFWGSETGGGVPDGGATAALLGVAAVGLSLLGRRKG